MNRVPMLIPAAQRQGGDQAPGVGHAAGRPRREFSILGGARQQDHVRHVVLAGMSAALETVDADGIAAICSAFSECRTEVHLWITLMPAAFNAGMYGSGLRPAVSTTVMRLPDGGDVFRIGRRAEARQEGQVDAERLVGEIAAARDFAGQQFRRLLVRPVMMPRPPALETAAASSANPT